MATLDQGVSLSREKATNPGPLIRSPCLLQSLRVLEFVDVALELPHVLLQLAILLEFLLKDVDKGLEWGFWELIAGVWRGVEAGD